MVGDQCESSSGSDTDDDYMSEAFTDKTCDVRPGIAPNRAQKRLLTIEQKRLECDERQRKQPKRIEVERELRDKALAIPVAETTKGFQMLTRMGYKPGMSLGLSRDGKNEGIKEPIAVQLKTGRSGLGHDTHEDEQRQKRIQLYTKKVAAQVKANEFLAEQFRERKRSMAILKGLIGDLVKSRKACQELDSRIGLKLPTTFYFWPIYSKEIEDDNSNSNIGKEEDECDRVFMYYNGKSSVSDLIYDEMTENDICERLEAITHYLRSEHRYCIWCGLQFDSVEQLLNDCPGETRADHENFDD